MYSKNFEKVRKYYNAGLWTFDQVYSAVGRWITESEYQEITGKAFE